MGVLELRLRGSALSIAALLSACSGSSSTAEIGPTNVPPMEPAGLYERCSARECDEGKCTAFVDPDERICAAKCETDDDCPADGDRNITCDEGRCRSYRCDDSTPHLTLLGNDLICVRGEVMACSDLSERPCQCPCKAVGAICDSESGLCVAAAELDEACEEDGECSSGYCAIPQFGGEGRCRLPAGAECNPANGGVECDASCNAVPGAGVGYCLVECEVYCSGSAGGGCSHRCEDSRYTCTADDICRKTCSGDEDCLEWELCEFASITEATGVCRPDPNAEPPAGGTGGDSGGAAGASGAGGTSGTSGAGGASGGSPGDLPLGEACLLDAQCESNVCAEWTFGGKRCGVALGEACFENQDACSYELADGRDSVCFSNGYWSTCAWRCGATLEPCPEGFSCAALAQETISNGCVDHGTWCMRTCDTDSDCGDAMWTCETGRCQPERLLVSDAESPSGCQ